MIMRRFVASGITALAVAGAILTGGASAGAAPNLAWCDSATKAHIKALNTLLDAQRAGKPSYVITVLAAAEQVARTTKENACGQ